MREQYQRPDPVLHRVPILLRSGGLPYLSALLLLSATYTCDLSAGESAGGQDSPAPLLDSQDSAASDSEVDSVDIDPRQLIEFMSDALTSLTYEGVFVHMQGTNLASMHIMHADHDDGEFARLRALDGEAREVLRRDSLLTCIWPDSQTIVVSEKKSFDPLPRVGADITDSTRYSFRLRSTDRVADRRTHVVDVIPRDRYRYGLRFWIDQKTYMLLRSMLLEGSRPVEQILFTQINYPSFLARSRFEIDTRPYDWLDQKQSQAHSAADGFTSETADRVRFSGLPDGFREISETFSHTPLQSGPVSHVMLSDGMASVSVYVEYISSGEHPAAALGLSRMGAVNAFGVSRPRFLITAIGEVPAAAVQAIADSVVVAE